MASDLDLKLTVSLDKDAIVNSYIKGLKEAQREADKQTVTYILKPDKTSFLNEMKNMLTSTPDLDKEVKILLDDSSFQKGLNDIEKYAGKKAKGITTAFQKEFQKEFKNENDPLFLNNILGLGQNENKSVPRVKKKIAEITQELSKFSNYTQDKKTGAIKINGLDLDKVSNYKDLERVVELTKQLDAILKQTNTKDYKVDLSNRKDLEESVNKLQSGYSKAMVQYRDDYKSQLESMKTDTEKMFSQLTEMFSNVMLGAIKKMEQAGQEMKDSFDKATEGMGENISDEISEGVEASKKHLKDLERELDEVQNKKKELGKSDKTTQEKLYADVIKAKRVVNDSLKRGDEVSKEDAQAYIKAMTKLTNGVASTKNNPKFETEKQDYEAVRGELGDQYVPINKMQTRIDLINEANNKEATLIKQIDEEKKKIEQSNKERAKTKDIKDKNDKQQEDSEDESQSKTKQDQQEPTETKIIVNEEEALESIKKIKDSLQELPEKKKIEINIETQNPDEIQNMVSEWNDTDDASNFDIKVKAKLNPDTSSDIQKQIDDIEPKPVVEVKAKIKPSEEIKVDDLLQDSKTIDSTVLSESTKYVNELKQGLIELGGMTQGLNFGKEFGGEAGEKEVERWNKSINDLLQKYPQLTKFRDVFKDSDETKNFINSNEWNNFLATLPQARTYLESIGYDFEKIDQVELSSKNEIKSLEGLRTILNEIRGFVDEKTQAFANEETKVNSVVDNEVTKLNELKGKVESIINEINTAIEKLHDPKNTELTFSPNLSKDFETKIQDLINSKTFEISLTPQLSNKINTNSNDLDDTIESDYLEEIAEGSKKLSKEEKKFDDVIKNALKGYLNGAPASTNARKLAKEALKNQVARNQIDSEELFEIFKNDPTYSSSQVGGNYMKIKNYLRNSKIKYSDLDRAEFGDDWQMVVDTIGQRNFSKTKGIDPETIIKELEKQYGEISSEGINNTQDALRRIFEYIKNTPTEYANRLEQRMASYKDQQMELDDAQLREATKNAVVPTSYLGEITADSSEELDRINSKYAAEQEKINAETEKQIELYYQEAQAAREDAKSQEELNKSKISPSQEFDNTIQKDLVYLENYKNTLLEIDKVKEIDPELKTDEAKRKIEELQKLADYFFGNISITKNQWGNDGGNFANDPYGTYRNRLDMQGYRGRASEIFKIGRGKTKLNVANLPSEFSGIGEELTRIESKSEGLRKALTKDLTESESYVSKLKGGIERLGESFDILHDPSYAHDKSYLESAQEDIDLVLQRFPELLQYKDKFATEQEAFKFTKTEEWNDFLATLPRAHTYLESIGYDFNKINEKAPQDFSEQNPIEENEIENINIDEEKSKLGELADFIKTEIPNAIEIKNKAFDEEKNHVDEIVDAEKSKFNELADFIKTEIPNAIAEKNTALDKDRDNINKAVDDEKEELTAEQDNNSQKEYQEESEKLNDVKDAAIDAGEAKKFFAEENREVLTSIIKSLSALNSEGEGFKHLNNIINKLSNEDKTNQLVENLKKIRDELTQPISNDSIINAIRDIAQQGDNLKDLAKVLQATQDQINKAKNAVKNNNKPQVNPITSDKKDVQSTQWNQTYDAHGNVTRDVRTFKERNEMGRTTEYTERRNPQTGELSYEIKEHTDYEKVISKTTDAIIRQAKAYHDLTLEMEKSNPDTDKLEALAREYDDCQRVINEATAAVVRFDGQTEHHHNDPATGSKFSYIQDFEQHVQNRTAYGLAKEDARYADYIAKRRENLNRQVDKDLFTAQFELDNGNHTDAFNDRLRDIINNLRTIQDIVRNNPEAITEREVELARQYSEELKRANKEGKLSANKEANEKSVAKGLARINKILSENTKLTFKSTDAYRELVSLQDEFSNFDTSRPQSELNDLNTALEKSISKFDGLSNVFKGKNFFETFLDHLRSTTAQLITQYLSFQDIIRYIRTLGTTIIDLDTQLVDLRKTTTMTTKDLEDFYYTSSNIGKQLGVTTSEVIQQASAWSRLGYSTKEASIEMAQLSSKFASISPGMTTENSTDYLVSTMQAYGIAVDDVERKILDNVNRIGNILPKHAVTYGAKYIA